MGPALREAAIVVVSALRLRRTRDPWGLSLHRFGCTRGGNWTLWPGIRSRHARCRWRRLRGLCWTHRLLRASYWPGKTLIPLIYVSLIVS